MGPKTLDEYIAPTRNPATRRALLDNMATDRRAWAKKNGYSISQNRLDYFRFLGKSL